MGAVVSGGGESLLIRTVVMWPWLWAALSSVMTLRLARSILSARGMIRSAASHTESSLLTAVANAARRFNLATPPLVVTSPRIQCPMVWCWRRPALILPKADVEQSARLDWEAVAVHELAHLARRDHWSAMASELLICLLPWNPVAWWTSRRLRHLADRACDDRVLCEGVGDVEYAETLLSLTPQSSPTIALSVIPSETGLTKRIADILTERIRIPYAGRLWIAAASLSALLLAAGISLAQPGRTEEQAASERVVRFPRTKSIGNLYVVDADKKRKIEDFHWHIDGIEWRYFGQAVGDVSIPPGKRLCLVLNKNAARNLSVLSDLNPDDLYKLEFPELYTTLTGPGIYNQVGDSSMRHLARLTGLRELEMESTRVTSKSMRFIGKMKSLERLWTSSRTTDAALAHIAELPSLKALYLTADYCTNAGLRHLEKLTSLEEMQFFMSPKRNHQARVDDDGLIHLTKLDSLTHLWLRGNFTGDGLVYLKEMDSLKLLMVAPWIATDAGLDHIGDIPGLEVLSLSHSKNITDRGLAHLTRLKTLKKLNLGSTPITDNGLVHLKEIKSLEQVDLPASTDTDRGLALLSELPGIRRLEVGMQTHSRITDKGLEHAAKHAELESLEISGQGITIEGMDHIAGMTTLKNLHLFSVGPYRHRQMTDEWLSKLTALRSLERLELPRNGTFTLSAISRLNNLRSLKTLRVYGIIQDGSVLDLSELTELTTLTLKMAEGHTLRDEDLASFSNLKRLESLRVGEPWSTSAIGDAGIAHLADMQSLERLFVGGRNITDEGLTHLRKLRVDYLRVAGDINDAGLRHLEANKHFQSIYIRTTGAISPSARERLRRKLDNSRLKVEPYPAKKTSRRKRAPTT